MVTPDILKEENIKLIDNTIKNFPFEELYKKIDKLLILNYKTENFLVLQFFIHRKKLQKDVYKGCFLGYETEYTDEKYRIEDLRFITGKDDYYVYIHADNDLIIYRIMEKIKEEYKSRGFIINSETIKCFKLKFSFNKFKDYNV